MSHTFELLQKAKQARGAATPTPAPIPARAAAEEEVPYIEVGGPDQIEGSAEVLACPPPARKLFLQPRAPAAPPTELEKPAAPTKLPAPATISFFSWNG